MQAHFKYACRSGELKNAARTLELNPALNVGSGFLEACAAGQLEMAQWLVKVAQGLNPQSHNAAFIWACSNGHLSVAQWLWQEFTIDPHTSDDFAFSFSCEHGHLVVAQWLRSVAPGVRCSPLALWRTCYDGFYDVAEWLSGVSPGLHPFYLRDARFRRVLRWL